MRGDRVKVGPRVAAVAAGYAAVVLALVWATSGPLAEVRRPGPAEFDTLLAAAAAAGAWLALIWLTVGFLVSALAALPGAVGAWSGRLSARIAPRAVRRTAQLLLGVSITAGAGLVATAPATAAATPPPVAATQALPSLDRPDLLAHGHDDTAADSAGQVAALRTPAPPPDLEPAAPAPTPAPTPVSGTPLPGPAPRDAAADVVVVQRDDTLWTIAARHLGPGATAAEIAAEWPRWHTANRDVIGDDPDLILPGQQLRPPGPSSAEESR